MCDIYFRNFFDLLASIDKNKQNCDNIDLEAEFKTIDEIKEVFSIDCDDIIEIKRELKKKKVELHPDKNQGKFKSQKIKNIYERIDSAIKFIDRILKNESQLIPISSIKEITNIVRDIIVLENKNISEKMEDNFYNKIDTVINEHISKNKKTKYFCSSILLPTTIIWLFPTLFNEHPILYQLLSSFDSFNTFWIFCVIIILSILLIVNTKNKKIIKAYQYLKSEPFQNMLFIFFIDNKSKGYKFSKDDFVESIRNFDYRTYETSRLIFLSRQIKIEEKIAFDVASKVLIRMEEKYFVKKIDEVSPFLSEMYELSIESPVTISKKK